MRQDYYNTLQFYMQDYFIKKTASNEAVGLVILPGITQALFVRLPFCARLRRARTQRVHRTLWPFQVRFPFFMYLHIQCIKKTASLEAVGLVILPGIEPGLPP